MRNGGMERGWDVDGAGTAGVLYEWERRLIPDLRGRGGDERNDMLAGRVAGRVCLRDETWVPEILNKI